VYLDNSKDILNLILAFCALTFTFFVCWLMWYLINIIRDVSRLVDEIQEKVAAIDHAVHSVKEKVETAFSSFAIASTGLKVLSRFMEKRKDKATKKAKSVAEDIRKKVSKVKKRLEEEMEEESEDLS
jgi:hypothetical protein